MLPRNHPDGIQITFDDHRLVNNAGLLLPSTLAQHLVSGIRSSSHKSEASQKDRKTDPRLPWSNKSASLAFSYPNELRIHHTRGLAGKPLAGFRTTPSKRITVIYGMIVCVIYFTSP